MGKIWDMLFKRDATHERDVGRIQRVMVAERRSERAALKALEIQLQVAKAIGPRKDQAHDRR